MEEKHPIGGAKMPQEVYGLSDGLERLRNLTAEKKAKTDNPFFVGIAGPSNSGKTTKVARALQGYFPDSSRILGMDDYLRDIHYMRKIGTNSFDDPRVTDFILLLVHFRTLKKRLPINKPIYSFDREGSRKGYAIFEPADIIIIEGLFALFDRVVRKMDLKVFVDVDIHGSLIRRLIRDPERTGQTEEEILRQYAETVYPDYRKHVEPTKSRADIVIVNNYNPVVEAYGCRRREIQAKVALPGNFSSAELSALGLRMTAVVLQEDRYYAAPHWSTSYFGELVKVRKESGRYYFIYKGPLVNGFFATRPKIEFEIDASMKDALERLGYQPLLRVEKVRQKYTFKGDIEVALDVIDGAGAFLEFSTVGPKDVPEIVVLLNKLGIDIESVTQKSYLEILSGDKS